MIIIIILDFETQTTIDNDQDTSYRFDSDDSTHEYCPNQTPMYSTMKGETGVFKNSVVDFDQRVTVLGSGKCKSLRKCPIRIKNWKNRWRITREFVSDYKKDKQQRKRGMDKARKEMNRQNKKKGCGGKCAIF